MCSTVSTQRLWKKRLDGVTTVLLGSVFEYENVLVLGTASGNIRIWSGEKELELLETKGGAIQAITLHNITNIRGKELIAGDVEGNVFIFCNHQILSRHSFGSPITQLVVHTDAVHNWSVVAGDQSGTVTSFRSYGGGGEHDWKFRVTDEISVKALEDNAKTESQQCIRCLQSVEIQDKFGSITSYLVVADGSNTLKFYCQRNLAHFIAFSTNVTTVATGIFTETQSNVQLVVGCSNGAVYLLDGFVHKELFNVGHPITQIVSVPSPQNYCYLLCIGHFNAVKVYYQSQLLVSSPTPDWPKEVTATYEPHTKTIAVTSSLLNNEIHTISVALNP
eukprot:TRINITY_DN15727_c0_g1_i1.p1 TRINITY_DN15727_c0_g1~~TRINITY_DN15727_c0_g1_i1.p1  ORF type:complete len:334 (+),score=24.48 TRINITY_DN15727_c0_g1_i1:59-1060(+)